MTLITYPTRVHFADDVLEEALYSEIERSGAHRLLLIGPEPLHGSEFHERVLTGLPRKLDITSHPFDVSEGYARALTLLRAQTDSPDLIIAWGSSEAITLGRKARAALSDPAARAQFIVVPNVDGLPDPCRKGLDTWRNSLPNVVICDPTVTTGADPAFSLRAALTSFVRCVESYLATPYNPLADGMALDGLHRCVLTIPRMASGDSAAQRREVMAAGLNAAMSQEKGIGPAQQIVAALAEVSQGTDLAAAIRLILPAAVQSMSLDGDKALTLRRLLGDKRSLDAGLRAFLGKLPMATRLSDLGLSRETLTRATTVAEDRFALRAPTVQAVFDSVY